MPSVSNPAAEQCLRSILVAEGFSFNSIRMHGQTGVDVLATRSEEQYHIEVIGYKRQWTGSRQRFSYRSKVLASMLRQTMGSIRILSFDRDEFIHPLAANKPSSFGMSRAAKPFILTLDIPNDEGYPTEFLLNATTFERYQDFYESFFRAISRIKDGAIHCVIAMPKQAEVGLPARTGHMESHGKNW